MTTWRQGRWFVAAGALAASVGLVAMGVHNGGLLSAMARSLNDRLPYGGFSQKALADWRAADPTNAAFVLFGIGFAVISVGIGVYQVFFDKTVSRDGDRTRRDVQREGELNRRDFAEVKAMMAALLSSQAVQRRISGVHLSSASSN